MMVEELLKEEEDGLGDGGTEGRGDVDRRGDGLKMRGETDEMGEEDKDTDNW